MPHEEAGEPRRTTTACLGARYTTGLTFAHLMTTTEVLAVVWSLTGQAFGNTQVLLTRSNLVLVAVVIVVGTVAVAVGGYTHIRPSLRWFLAGTTPDVLLLANVDAGIAPAMLIAFAVAFGGTSTVSTSLLFTQRIYRPVVAAATEDSFSNRITAPGIATRLVLMWLVNSALPSATIVALILCKSKGWLIPTTASVDVPIVVLAVVSVVLGLRALILVARSIADPVRDVVDGMAEVEQGRIGRTVDVYEQSEIGSLQNGFNSMVKGLAERDRIRDLWSSSEGTARPSRRSPPPAPSPQTSAGCRSSTSASASRPGPSSPATSAPNRYEYTVIGDPVNEAARLADSAKTILGRAMASGAAITRADDTEREQWIAHGSTMLRGRGEATQVSIPRDREERIAVHDDRFAIPHRRAR